MKKITAFFMALLPVFVVALLFTAGFIIKSSIHVAVSSIELDNSLEIKKEDDTTPLTETLVANVLPWNASNPELYWTSTDESVVKVEADANTSICKATITGMGDAYITATSKDDPTKKASTRVRIWDDKIHSIEVTNKDELSYIGAYEEGQIKLNVRPSSGVLNPKLKYQVTDGSDKIIMHEDGTFRVKDEPGEVKLIIKPEDDKALVKEVPVTINVGKGVLYLSETGTANTITSSTFNFKDNLITYPEANKDIGAENFNFTSSDDSIATIDANGKVSFKQANKFVTVTASLKRKPELTVSKTIQSTCDTYKNVYFNTYLYNKKIGVDVKISSELPDLFYDIYPHPARYQQLGGAVEITSSNPEVVEAMLDTNNIYHFLLRGAGTTLLTATINKDNPELRKTDVCLVNISNNDKTITDTVNLTDTYYYNLRSNQKVQESLFPSYQDITWKITPHESDAPAILSKESIVFKQGGTVTVEGTAANEQKIQITISASTVDPVNISGTENIKLKVGIPYHFDRYEVGSRSTDQAYVQPNAYTLIPVIGGKGEDCPIEIYNGILFPTTAYPTIEEPLAGITYLNKELNPLDITYSNEYAVGTYLKAQPKPSTAMDADGNPYTIKYSMEQSSIATYDEQTNKITFTASGAVNMNVTCGNITDTFVIYSTFNDAGKFVLSDESGKKYYSGDQTNRIQISQDEEHPTKLFIDIDSYSRPQEGLEELFKTFKSDNGTVKFKADGDKIARYDTETQRIYFECYADKNALGNNIVTIETGSYSFYLYTTVEKKINDFALLFQDKILGDEVNVYMSDFKVRVLSLPLISDSTEQLAYKCYINDSTEPYDFADHPNIIKFENFTSDTRVKLVADDGRYERTFTLSKKDNPEFTIREADENKNLYLSSNQTSTILTVEASEGSSIIEPTYFDNMFDIKLNDETETQKLEDGKIYIAGLPSPTKEQPGYTAALNVYAKNTTELKDTFKLSRDVVSRIVFPKHDNKDPADLKGLQKVRVFGNQTLVNGEAQPFYALPITLYDYKNEPIEDDVKNQKFYKEEAFNTLISKFTGPSASGSTAKYHRADKDIEKGFVEISFDSNSLYTSEEIFNNAFETKSKNICYKLENHTNANAQYDFVPVNGINAYDQDAFIYASKKLKAGVEAELVLQTNFGLTGGEKDNKPLDSEEIIDVANIYGNGYAVNVEILAKNQEKIRPGHGDVNLRNILNATISGQGTDDVPPEDNTSTILLMGDRLVRYNIIKNTARGLWISHCTKSQVKNCLFYNNRESCLVAALEGESAVYVEDCEFFNSAVQGIRVDVGAKVFIKGKIISYNFHNKECLRNIWGYDFRPLWDLLVSQAREQKCVQIGADGREYVNMCMLSIFGQSINFWNPETQQYEEAEHGNPGAADHIMKLIELDLGSFGKANMWGTRNPDVEEGCPSYYDEFDTDGNLRLDVLNRLIVQIQRITE